MTRIPELFAGSVTKDGLHGDVLVKKAEKKAIDATDVDREWTDEELEQFTEDDVKFALGSSVPEMREILRTKPNGNA